MLNSDNAPKIGGCGCLLAVGAVILGVILEELARAGVIPESYGGGVVLVIGVLVGLGIVGVIHATLLGRGHLDE